MGEFEAIAVGGGLAGSSFALELARSGACVAVVERTTGPRLKVCGDFLSIEAHRLLAYLGIDLETVGAQRVTRLRLSSGRSSATLPLPFAGAALSRLRLDETMLGAAAAAGAHVLRGVSATGLELRSDHVLVKAGKTALRAKAVALATGKHNLRGFPRGDGGPMTGFKIMLEPSQAACHDLTRTVHLGGHAGGYAGACLVEGGAMAVCWLTTQNALARTGADWRRQFDSFARQNQAFGDLVASARPISEKPAAVSAIPFGYRRSKAIADNVYPLGDQLAVIPSFTGDGTSIALLSGIRAARAVLAGQSASACQQAFITGLHSQFRWAGAIDGAFSSAPTRWLGIRLAAAFPAIVARLGERTRLTVGAELYRSSIAK